MSVSHLYYWSHHLKRLKKADPFSNILCKSQDCVSMKLWFFTGLVLCHSCYVLWRTYAFFWKSKLFLRNWFLGIRGLMSRYCMICDNYSMKIPKVENGDPETSYVHILDVYLYKVYSSASWNSGHLLTENSVTTFTEMNCYKLLQ